VNPSIPFYCQSLIDFYELEKAHQWFGNLVTMEWWTHLWLNEGFASFMEYLCTDAIFPEWRIWEQFVSHDMFGAMNLDALDSSHPIEVEVGHPSEVDEIFDQISYSKVIISIKLSIFHEDFRVVRLLECFTTGSATLTSEKEWKII